MIEPEASFRPLVRGRSTRIPTDRRKRRRRFLVVPHGSSLPYTTDSTNVWCDIYRSVCLYAVFKYDSTQGTGTPVLSPMEGQVPRKGLHFKEPSLPLCHMLEGL